MKPTLEYDTPTCRHISEILSRVGDKWTVLVVTYLGERTHRFNELKARIGRISQKMLTTTLRNLERDGFVTRTVYPTIPPRVDYELTDLGRELLVPVAHLAMWSEQNIHRIEAARSRFDQAHQDQVSERRETGRQPHSPQEA